MDKKELRERYIENICNITEQQRIDLNYTVTQKQEMDKCRLELENPNLTIIDEEDMFDDTSLDTIIEIAKTCDMLFIDNFNDIRHHGENKWDEQEKIGKKIKTLINSTPKAIIMLHHFSKGQTGKDKAEGGGSQTLVNVATRWVTIERDMEDVCADSGVERTVKIKVQKNRPGGRISSVEIAYNNGRYRETIGGQDYELLQYDNPIDDQPSELL